MPAVPKAGSKDELFALWHRLAAFPASQTDAALQHLQTWIEEAIDADNVIWIGALKILHGEAAKTDAFLGWRLRDRVALRPDPAPYRRQLAEYYDSEHYGKLTPTYYKRSHEAKKEDHIGMDSHASMSGTGRFRCHRLRDGWLDFETFKHTPHYKRYYEASGIVDRIMISFPLTPDHESFFMIDRIRTKASRRHPFNLREATLAGDAIHGAPQLHHRLFLGNGLFMGDKLLSPMERQILQGLLKGLSEKEIAVSTGQKIATLHKYVTALHARFGVKSRPALMALWLGGEAAAGKPVPFSRKPSSSV